MSKRQLAVLVAALAWCGWYGIHVVVPAARARTNGFAAYYTAAWVLAYAPEAYWHAYDETWFGAQVRRSGFPDVREVFRVQPPPMGLILLPLAGLRPQTARAVWTALNLGLLAGGLMALARALKLRARWGLWALPACLLYGPLTENLRQGQGYLLLFCLLSLLFWALLAERDGVAGAALGGMLALKTAALWLWPLLLLARRWRLLAWAALVAASLGLAMLVWAGPEPWLAYAAQLPLLATLPERSVTAYQTVTSLTNHLLAYDARWNPAPVVDWPAVAQALNLSLLLGTLAISSRWGRLQGEHHTPRVLTLALFTALVPPNAPVGEGHHYLLALPALLVAAWWAWRSRPGPWTWATLAIVAVLLGAPFPYRSPRLAAGWLALLAYPRVYGAYALWGWLGWALRQEVALARSLHPAPFAGALPAPQCPEAGDRAGEAAR